MPLKSETIDWIFAKMTIRYGASWLAKWNGVPMEAVAHDWAVELERMSRDSIVYALGYLPLEYPPTVAQFKAICARAPERGLVAIADHAKADEAVVKAIVTGIKQKRLEMGPRAWAYRLEEREKLDRRSLTEFQRFAWREAMKNEPVNTVGHHTPIPERMLPPAMREPA